ncbi:hypothetical protein NDU88_004142 [Pleurodeles waltl]|uniref:Uncharacterized protein n=1 Tax=Pleurodeles waltl TaxID=8319 RepID=A0AAV7RIN8_PLEWA|nr:hypothetical protein NDU88_004142 [Pleurodeles waltl]
MRQHLRTPGARAATSICGLADLEHLHGGDETAGSRASRIKLRGTVGSPGAHIDNSQQRAGGEWQRQRTGRHLRPAGAQWDGWTVLTMCVSEDLEAPAR